MSRDRHRPGTGRATRIGRQEAPPKEPCKGEADAAPYRLVASTADLVVSGESFPGLPLFKPRDALIDAVPSLWVLAGVRERSYSLNTVEAYATGLLLFLNSQEMAAPDIGWQRATKDDVVRFKRELAARGNDADTIALRLAAVENFYAWAETHGFVRVKPFKVNPKDGGPAPVVKAPPSTRARKEVFTEEQFERIRACIVMDDPILRRRVDLMFRWGWGVGLRVAEVCGLSVRNLRRSVEAEAPPRSRGRSLGEAFAATAAEGFVLDLVPAATKGAKGGAVLVPRALMKPTVEWIDGFRAEFARAGADWVFVTESGTPLTPETLGRYFLAAVKAAKEVGSFHSLRHSYATRVLSEFNRLGHPELGALFVQKQLRHAYRETTEQYTHMVHMRDHAITAGMAVNRAFGGRN